MISGQADGGDILGCFDARCAHRLSEVLLPAAFWHICYQQESNERLPIMNRGRIAAAKRLRRHILIAVNVWLNIMSHFHRMRAVTTLPFRRKCSEREKAFSQCADSFRNQFSLIKLASLKIKPRPGSPLHILIPTFGLLPELNYCPEVNPIISVLSFTSNFNINN